MNQPENRLSDAFRRLRAMAPQGASPALGDILKNEYLRHHARRGRNRTSKILSLAACLAASVVLSVIFLRPRASSVREIPGHLQTAPQSETVAAAPIGPAVSKPAVEKTRAPIRIRGKTPTEGDRFVALPTFDPAIPIENLEMVRLELPARSLRLVGFPVSEELAEGCVLADVLLAQDGTPYALRLVRSSESKERWQ